MLTEGEQEVVSGLLDLLDNLMTGTTPLEVLGDYHRLRFAGMELAGES